MGSLISEVNSMKKGFIVVEGVCNSGKTSLLRSMEEDGHSIICETNKRMKNFPQPPKNYKEARRNESLILGLELQRMKEGLEKSKSGLCFADRGLPSVIAITSAYSIINGYNTLDDLYKDIICAIGSDINSFKCDCYIYLKVKPGTVKLRNRLRDNKLDQFWINDRTIRFQLEFYKTYEKIMQIENWMAFNTEEVGTKTLKQKVLNYQYKPFQYNNEILINQYTRLFQEIKKLNYD